MSYYQTSRLVVPLPGPMGITGTVTDVNGKPIEGATVTLDSIISDRTNAEGKYGITVIAPGTFQLTVVKEGYPTATAKVTVHPNEIAVQHFTLGVKKKVPIVALGLIGLMGLGLFAYASKKR
ncbi:MAG: carboxypeptidase-like regulatory domain-containing protein [Candidatus Heimdallarchaeaceae archaeon]